MRKISRRGFLRSAGAAVATAAVAGRLPAPTAAAATSRQPGRLRFGVQTAPQFSDYDSIEGVWREVDELGFDSIFVFDHFIPIFTEEPGPCFEGWTLLAALAARTQRARVGVLVTGNTYRHPAVVAKMAATIDHTTKGRLILGMGAGWFEREHEAYGIPFHSVGGRARRLVESVEVMKRLFTQDNSSFTGKYYSLSNAPFDPKPVQKPHPPILIGGMGPKVIQPLAARHADIWHFFARSGKAEEARQICQKFDAICRDVGRKPEQVEKSTSIRPQELVGLSPKALRDHVRAFADAGVEHFIVSLRPPYDRSVLRRFAAEVLPAFREESADRVEAG